MIAVERQSARSLVPQMLALRAEGLSATAVGARLGLSDSTVRNWWAGETCATCGSYIDRSSGAPVTRLCADCCSAAQHDARAWTREAIIAAFQEFAARTGRTPTVTDTHLRADGIAWTRCLSVRRREEVPRELLELLPSQPAVRREFGSWPAATAAAGLPNAPRGGAARRPVDSRPREGEAQSADKEREQSVA